MEAAQEGNGSRMAAQWQCSAVQWEDNSRTIDRTILTAAPPDGPVDRF